MFIKKSTEDTITKYSSEAELKNFVSIFSSIFQDYYKGKDLGRQLFIRELKALYRGSLLGFAWSVVPPIVTAFTWILLNNNKVVSFDSNSIPYPVFALLGTSLWQMFTDSIVNPLKSVRVNKPILTKLNFPRQAILLSAFYETLFQMGIKLAIIVFTLVYFQVNFTASMFLAVIPIVLILLSGFSLGVLLTPAGALFKDITMALPYLMQLIMYMMPVIYPPKIGDSPSLTDKIIFNNPLAKLITEGRNLLSGQGIESLEVFIAPALMAIFVFVVAHLLFKLSQTHLISRMGS